MGLISRLPGRTKNGSGELCFRWSPSFRLIFSTSWSPQPLSVGPFKQGGGILHGSNVSTGIMHGATMGYPSAGQAPALRRPQPADRHQDAETRRRSRRRPPELNGGTLGHINQAHLSCGPMIPKAAHTIPAQFHLAIYEQPQVIFGIVPPEPAHSELALCGLVKGCK